MTAADLAAGMSIALVVAVGALIWVAYIANANRRVLEDPS